MSQGDGGGGGGGGGGGVDMYRLVNVNLPASLHVCCPPLPA